LTDVEEHPLVEEEHELTIDEETEALGVAKEEVLTAQRKTARAARMLPEVIMMIVLYLKCADESNEN
jgi:hypothetical protein